MNKFYRWTFVFLVLTLPMAACHSNTIQASVEVQPAPEKAAYDLVLGHALSDKEVINFISHNNCLSANQFQLCKEAGMALWLDSSQIVQTVYLYLNNTEGFTPYKGELPLGLKFYDTMGAVEYKLKRQGVGIAGLPDSGGTPDHMHYRAVYKQAGMTVIYNSPFVDEDATIYAVLVKKVEPQNDNPS